MANIKAICGQVTLIQIVVLVFTDKNVSNLHKTYISHLQNGNKNVLYGF